MHYDCLYNLVAARVSVSYQCHYVCAQHMVMVLVIVSEELHIYEGYNDAGYLWVSLSHVEDGIKNVPVHWHMLNSCKFLKIWSTGGSSVDLNCLLPDTSVHLWIWN